MKTKVSKTSGVYEIYCTQSKKRYIGSAINILRRWYSHSSLLRRNIHKNSHLQSAYNKYGKDCFEIKVIEQCEEKELENREIYWIDYYHATDKNFGYNQADPLRKTMSPEIRNKIRMASIGRIVNQEWKNNISKGKKESHFKYGLSQEEINQQKIAREKAHLNLGKRSAARVWTEDQRAIVSLRFKGKRASETTKNKMSIANKGKKLLNETRNKLSESRLKYYSDKRTTHEIKLSGNFYKITNIYSSYIKAINWLSELLYNKYSPLCGQNITFEKPNNLSREYYFTIRNKFSLPSQVTQSIFRQILGDYKSIQRNGKWETLVYANPEMPLGWKRDFNFSNKKGLTIWKDKFSLDCIEIPKGKWKDSKIKYIENQWRLMLVTEK